MVAPASRLVVLGHGAHARVVQFIAASLRWTCLLVDKGDPIPNEPYGIVGVGNSNMRLRKTLYDGMCKRGMIPQALTVTDVLGDPGSIIMQGVIIGSDVQVGENTVLYSGCIIEHDCQIDPHAYLSPGVILSGNVHVKEGAFLGSGAVVLPGIKIGAWSTVGAGAVVTKDVQDGQTVKGVPAR
jgi:sugar O-acyltransferase (sialic acid O-acetyltransferase NeuD family)